ncbi:hypothetical protein EAI_00487 [Harpegnathos saltator]|uniref:Uncharacterized protein n=1 Tax=Harpegnathos saltator TaxID=610380 RepID=E2C8B8_HARSA|nr:hypothetical protein EAI_00487 [Harpegnathos saltator]
MLYVADGLMNGVSLGKIELLQLLKNYVERCKLLFIGLQTVYAIVLNKLMRVQQIVRTATMLEKFDMANYNSVSTLRDPHAVLR